MNPIVAKVAGELVWKGIEIAADVIEKSLPKNAADDQREQDRLRELQNVAVLGGKDD